MRELSKRNKNWTGLDCYITRTNNHQTHSFVTYCGKTDTFTCWCGKYQKTQQELKEIRNKFRPH